MGSWYKQIMAWFVRDIWHKYHSWYFKIVSNFTRLTAREITYNNFEISLVVFIPNITTNHAITYTNLRENLNAWGGERLLSGSGVGLVGVRGLVRSTGSKLGAILETLRCRTLQVIRFPPPVKVFENEQKTNT